MRRSGSVSSRGSNHGHKSLLALVAPTATTWGHKELLKLRNFLDSENGDPGTVAKRHLAAMRHEVPKRTFGPQRGTEREWG